mmetsp:Transcript_63577/g.176288  ORF Transcript_63577/g.176288 Transcript_63577/m.176288 type:complete len:208 (+) Transcript_63577:1955-2578(+)
MSSASSAFSCLSGSREPCKPAQAWRSSRWSLARPASGSRPPVSPKQPAASTSRSCARPASGRRLPCRPTQREMRRTSSVRRCANGSRLESIASLQLKSTSRSKPHCRMVSERKPRQVEGLMPILQRSWKVVAGCTSAVNTRWYCFFKTAMSVLRRTVFFLRASLNASGVKASRRVCGRHASRKKYNDRLPVPISPFVFSINCKAAGR